MAFVAVPADIVHYNQRSCSAFNDTVLDDHARDSFYFCLIDILTGRSTKTLRVSYLRLSFFSNGVVRERDRGLQRCLLLGIFLAALEQTEAFHDGAPDAKKPTRTALHFRDPGARQGHICYLTHGLEGLDVDLHVLYENKVLRCDNDVVGDLVHRPRKRTPPDSCTTLLAIYSCPSIICFTAGFAGVFTALYHMCKAW